MKSFESSAINLNVGTTLCWGESENTACNYSWRRRAYLSQLPLDLQRALQDGPPHRILDVQQVLVDVVGRQAVVQLHLESAAVGGDNLDASAVHAATQCTEHARALALFKRTPAPDRSLLEARSRARVADVTDQIHIMQYYTNI